MPIHDAALWAAYTRTDYVVHAEGREIIIQVGERSPALDGLLRTRDHRSGTFVTAANPGSERLDEDENHSRNQKLRAEIEAVGLVFAEGEGRPHAGHWSPEASFFVFDQTQDESVELARRYGQRAIVYVERGGAPALVDCGTSVRNTAGRVTSNQF